MDSERIQRIQDLYHSARKRGLDRDAFLAESTEADEDLIRVVAELLAEDLSDGPLDRSVLDMAAPLLANDRLAVGARLGHYTILSHLGTGGMGDVYRAHDSRLGRDVALKFLAEHFDLGFRNEAQAVAALNHPNVCTLYDIGPDFLVMEVIDGPTLAERIADGPIPIAEALSIARQIADALDAAHRIGVVHCDIKPANIKIRSDGVAKVLDFGVARRPTQPPEPASANVEQAGTNSIDESGSIRGTAAYMSPEQALGKPIDKGTDIWAFGVVLYEMVTGERLFQGRDVSETLDQVRTKTPDLAAVPRNLQPLLRACLERDPRERLRDIGDAWKLIREDASGDEVSSSKPALAFGWIAAAVCAGGLAVLALTQFFETSQPGQRVTRFEHRLPEGQVFRAPERPMLAVSADGTRFAYNTSQGIMVRSLDSEAVHLVPGTEVAAGRPIFSADGEWLGYSLVTPEGMELRRVRLSGGPSFLIGPIPPAGATGITWQSDGTILYGGRTSILRRPVDGGEPEELFPALDAWFPQILLDGDSILFTTPEEPYQINVQRSNAAEPALSFPGYGAHYLADERQLVYFLNGDLVAVEFDPVSLQRGDPVTLAEDIWAQGGNQGVPQFAISDSGTLVYLQSGASSENRRLAFFNREDGSRDYLAVPTRHYFSPRISPDGSRIAVESLERDGRVIWIYDLDGARPMRRLPAQRGNNTQPLWRDNNHIVFASDRDGSMSIYLQDVDSTGTVERLTEADEGTEHFPESFHPNGQVLSFSVRYDLDAGKVDIWMLDIGTGDTRELAAVPGYFFDVTSDFSPDGSVFAYASGTGAVNLYVETFPPTGYRRLVVEQTGGFPLWSPTGDELFFRPSNGGEADVRTLFSVPVSTKPTLSFGAEQQVIQGFVVDRLYRNFDTIDGQRFLMVFPADEQEFESGLRVIHVVQNLFAEGAN